MTDIEHTLPSTGDEEEAVFPGKIPYDFALEHQLRCRGFAWLLENALEVRTPDSDELQGIVRLAKDIAASARELFQEVQKETVARDRERVELAV